MKYIVVRTYGNGQHMNRVYPMYFDWLSQAERYCDELNKRDKDVGSSDEWIPMPLTEYIGDVW